MLNCNKYSKKGRERRRLPVVVCAKFVFFILESEPSSGELRPVSRDAYQGPRRPRGKGGGGCQGGLSGAQDCQEAKGCGCSGRPFIGAQEAMGPGGGKGKESC